MKDYPPIRVHHDHQVLDEYPAGHDRYFEGEPGREVLVIVHVSQADNGDEVRSVVKRYAHGAWHAAGEQSCAGDIASSHDCEVCHLAFQPVVHIGHAITGLEDPRLIDALSCGCTAGELHRCQ